MIEARARSCAARLARRPFERVAYALDVDHCTTAHELRVWLRAKWSWRGLDLRGVRVGLPHEIDDSDDPLFAVPAMQSPQVRAGAIQTELESRYRRYRAEREAGR